MTSTFSLRVHHFAVSAPDLEKTAAWYRDKLQFTEEYRYAIPEIGLQAVFLSLEDFRLEIFQMSESRPPEDDQLDFGSYLAVNGLKHVALAVGDVMAARQDLEQRGVSFITEVMDVPNSDGEKFCFFADPDGVLIELFQASVEHDHPDSST